MTGVSPPTSQQVKIGAAYIALSSCISVFPTWGGESECLRALVCLQQCSNSAHCDFKGKLKQITTSQLELLFYLPLNHYMYLIVP